MIQKHFNEISKDDIDDLVINAVPEGKTIEYKQSLDINTDKEKKEFLRDISSFANAGGGDILYGVEESRDDEGHQNGIPKVANGLSGINADQEILRLDNLAQTCLDPRIPGLQIKSIPGFPNGPILLIRIPKSWKAPHMITFQSESHFYSRNNARKYALDVTEIRSAFGLSDAIPDKVRHFRDERLARIIAGETPVPFSQSPKTVLHLLPIQALDKTFGINLSDVEQAHIFPFGTRGTDNHYNFDGFINYAHNLQQICSSYIQFFRNGAIEALTTGLFLDPNSNGERSIPGYGFERNIIEKTSEFLRLESKWNTTPPYFLMISLIDVKGFVVTARSDWPTDNYPIDRDVLILPDLLIEDGVNIANVLKPVFDTLWQSSGWVKSMSYDEKGDWQLRR